MLMGNLIKEKTWNVVLNKINKVSNVQQKSHGSTA